MVETVKSIKDRRRKAFLTTFIFVCLVLLVLFLVSFTVHDPPLVDTQLDEEEIPVEMEDPGQSGGGTPISTPQQQTSSQSNPTPPAPPTPTDNDSDWSEPSGETPVDNPGDSPQQGNDLFNFGGMQGDGGDGGGEGGGEGDEHGLGPGIGNAGVGEGPGDRGILNKPDFDWPGADGTVELLVYVYPSGKIKDVKHIGGSITHRALIEKCIKEAKRQLKYAPMDTDKVLKQYFTYRLLPE